MGLMLPSHRAESCLQVNDAIISLILTNEPSSKLEKDQEGEFKTSISTTTSKKLKNLYIYDIDSTKLESNDWCTSYSTTASATTITPGSITTNICGLTFDGLREGFSFVMPKIASPTCSDTDSGIWSYWLEPQSTLD